ncbi:hypothetical protein [Phycicoccus flavus]|uniref:hypothetical protein n=1 Tax=Phycicoccus flavus TaxID=2502783 RepID=UPI000FEB8007|nr:hypothetical protein [Phycicoccus flavus]NHA66934.1 hypothetical protein [Phycicoccus flavus]
MTTNTNLWTTVKDELRERRERREATRRLRADLAAYRTPTEVEDLMATVDAHEAAGLAPDAPVIRGILQDNLRGYYEARQAPMRQAIGL